MKVIELNAQKASDKVSIKDLKYGEVVITRSANRRGFISIMLLSSGTFVFLESGSIADLGWVAKCSLYRPKECFLSIDPGNIPYGD